MLPCDRLLATWLKAGAIGCGTSCLGGLAFPEEKLGAPRGSKRCSELPELLSPRDITRSTQPGRLLEGFLWVSAHAPRQCQPQHDPLCSHIRSWLSGDYGHLRAALALGLGAWRRRCAWQTCSSHLTAWAGGWGVAWRVEGREVVEGRRTGLGQDRKVSRTGENWQGCVISTSPRTKGEPDLPGRWVVACWVHACLDEICWNRTRRCRAGLDSRVRWTLDAEPPDAEHDSEHLCRSASMCSVLLCRIIAGQISAAHTQMGDLEKALNN